jgi:hypothetical protein
VQCQGEWHPPTNHADGKVRLLEVSLYAKGPRKGDVCPDVAFHEEMPKIPLKVHVEQHTPHA